MTNLLMIIMLELVQDMIKIFITLWLIVLIHQQAWTLQIMGIDDGITPGSFLVSAAGESMLLTADNSEYSGDFKLALSSLHKSSCDKASPLFFLYDISYSTMGTSIVLRSKSAQEFFYKVSINKVSTPVADQVKVNSVQPKLSLSFLKCTDTKCEPDTEEKFQVWYYSTISEQSLKSTYFHQLELINKKKEAESELIRVQNSDEKELKDIRIIFDLKRKISTINRVMSWNPKISYLVEIFGAISVANSMSRCCSNASCLSRLKKVLEDVNPSQSNFKQRIEKSTEISGGVK